MELVSSSSVLEECVQCISAVAIISGQESESGGGENPDEALFDQEKLNPVVPQVNETVWELPIDMRFNDGHVISIVVYSMLMVFSTVGNVTVLLTILRFRRQGRLSRINLFLIHLSIADLLVTFLLMPLEIGWAWAVSWTAGDGLCRTMAFFRIFGLYLSGFLLVCISVDRCFAVLKPLYMHRADQRGKLMPWIAWISSGICSVPQALVFHVESHPVAVWFTQCVTFNSFPSRETELIYYAFGFIFLYGFPLVMILGCYLCILWKIYAMNKQSDQENLRRCSTAMLGRAKMKTLRLTVTIVATFFLCWTPYNVMTLVINLIKCAENLCGSSCACIGLFLHRYWIAPESAMTVDQRVQKGLFLFACTNSCVNPLVYGYFHFGRKGRTVRAAGQRPEALQRQAFRVRGKESSECGNYRAEEGTLQSEYSFTYESNNSNNGNFREKNLQKRDSCGTPNGKNKLAIIFEPHSVSGEC